MMNGAIGKATIVGGRCSRHGFGRVVTWPTYPPIIRPESLKKKKKGKVWGHTDRSSVHAFALHMPVFSIIYRFPKHLQNLSLKTEPGMSPEHCHYPLSHQIK